MKVITIGNQKGGVGKTTTAVSLGHGLALAGKETVIVDLDPQGNAAKMLGLVREACVHDMVMTGRLTKEMIRKAREKLFIVPGNEETVYAQIMLAVKGKGVDYLSQILKPFSRNGPDYVIFDTSPSVGGLQERAFYAADLVVVPSATEYLSADAISETIGTVEANFNHGWRGSMLILPTFFDERTRLAKEILGDLTEVYKAQVMPPIHQATVLKDCAAEGKTIWEMDGYSRAAAEYSNLVYLVMGSK